MAESFFATLEREVLNRRRFQSQAEARMAIFQWLEGWDNRLCEKKADPVLPRSAVV